MFTKNAQFLIFGIRFATHPLIDRPDLVIVHIGAIRKLGELTSPHIVKVAYDILKKEIVERYEFWILGSQFPDTRLPSGELRQQ